MTSLFLRKTYVRTLITSIIWGISMQAIAANSVPLDNIVAVVDNDIILGSELSKAMQAATAQADSANPPSKEEVLKQLILQHILSDMLAKSGFQISDEQLNATMLNIARSQGADSIAQMQLSMDKSSEGSYAQLRSNVSKELALRQLKQQAIGSKISVSEAQIDSFIKSPESEALFQPQYFLEALIINAKNKQSSSGVEPYAKKLLQQLASQKSATAQFAKTASNDQFDVSSTTLGWKAMSNIPPIFRSAIGPLENNQFSDAVNTPQGVYIFHLLEKRDPNHTIIPQRQVSHILIKADSASDPSLAKAKINRIYNDLQHGDDFATLASKYSEDSGSAAKNGELGWVSSGEMVAPFEQMMVQTAVGDYSKPFQTQFGWHILKVFAERMHNVSDDYKRNLARQALMEKSYAQAEIQWLDDLYQNAYIDIK